MLKKLEFKLLFLTLILLPIIKGNIRNIFFMIIIIIGTHFIILDLIKNEFKISFKKQDIQGKILIASLILMAYCIFNIIINGFSYSVLERSIQLYACLTVLLASSIYEWSEKDYKFCINIIRIIILLCLILYPVIGINKGYYSGIFSSGNSLGGVLFCYLGIYLAINRKYSILDKFIITVSFILMYVSKCRSTLLSLIIFIIFRYMFTRKIIRNNKWIMYLLIITFTLFPIIYVYLYNSEIRYSLNELSRKYFNKNFFSGRQVLWEYIINGIKDRPFIGFGLDMVPEQLIGIGRSSHNWYIQILLQVGIIGYWLLINIISIIWTTLNKKKHSFSSLSICAFIIGMLLWQCFEVALTQNNIAIGILIWFIMGMGINEYVDRLSKDKIINENNKIINNGS